MRDGAEVISLAARLETVPDLTMVISLGGTDRSTLYEALGVSADAETDTIKRAYRAAVLQLHPDKVQQIFPVGEREDSRMRFQRVQLAWEVLRDRRTRQRYDEALGLGAGIDGDSEGLSDVGQVAIDVDLAEMRCSDATGEYIYSMECRCGRFFKISEDELGASYEIALRDEEDVGRVVAVAIGCDGCTCFIRVRFQEAV